MTTLTPDTAPEAVLHLAKGLARRFTPWGALEWQDYVGLACLGFYEARARWPGWGDFKRYALRCMDGAIREARRQEARHQLGTTTRSSKAVGSPSLKGGSRAGGRSALPLVSTPRYRRPGSRREHNRTYYYRTHERQHCRDCGTLIDRGHGARRCIACVMGSRSNPCACGCGTLVRHKWVSGHSLLVYNKNRKLEYQNAS